MRNKRSIPASSCAFDRVGNLHRLGGLQPARELLQTPAPGPGHRAPSEAASLSISIKADAKGTGSPDRSSISRIRPTWPRRIVALNPRLGQGPVGQPDDFAIGHGSRIAQLLDPHLLELAEPAGARGLIAENRAGVADPPGQGAGSDAAV